MSDNKSWKDKLLSSGIPLEFEVAKILAQKGYAIDSDYSYSRSYDGTLKDSSVDILATGYFPLKDPNKINVNLFLLIECKYRAPQTKWLFLPEINHEDFSRFQGPTVSLHDNFSAFEMDNKNIRDFSLSLNGAYKGVEVDLGKKGGVYDSEIKRGLNQLRYALPRIYCDSITNNAFNHPDDSVPLLFCPIIVTTADLFLLKEESTIEFVKNTNEFEDISEPTNFVDVYSDYGPDFEAHCRESCTDLLEIDKYDRNNIFKKRTEMKIDGYDFTTPYYLAHSLASGHPSFLKRNFTQFIVCNFSSLQNLLESIEAAVDKDILSLKQVIIKE